jgi:hypothetical protein
MYNRLSTCVFTVFLSFSGFRAPFAICFSIVLRIVCYQCERWKVHCCLNSWTLSSLVTFGVRWSEHRGCGDASSIEQQKTCPHTNIFVCQTRRNTLGYVECRRVCVIDMRECSNRTVVRCSVFPGHVPFLRLTSDIWDKLLNLMKRSIFIFFIITNVRP